FGADGRPTLLRPRRDGGSDYEITNFAAKDAGSHLAIRGEHSFRVSQDPMTKRPVDITNVDWVELVLDIDPATNKATGTATWGSRLISNGSGNVKEIGPNSSKVTGALESRGSEPPKPVEAKTTPAVEPEKPPTAEPSHDAPAASTEAPPENP